MAVNSNGSLKPSNGHLNGKAASKPPARRGRAGRKQKGFVSWSFNAAARLTTYFAIYTLLFRCPQSLDACDENTSPVCKYYFQAKDVVLPHAQPYWNQYAAPYVEIAQPYYDAVNQKVITPARSYAVAYGAPYVNKARDFGLAQWEKNGQPQLQELQTLAKSHYDKSVAPHVAKAGETVGPYYDVASKQSSQVYNEYILPGYVLVQPYAAQGYEVAYDFTTGTALPTAYWAWNKTYTFIDTAVWPQLRIVYLENVEPQLTRIGERLGRYKTNTKSKSPISNGADNAESSTFSKPTSQPTASTASSVAAESTPDATASEDADFIAKPVEAPPAAENESEKRQKARNMVAEDLELWQTKFAARADEGANDMEERVNEIAKRMIETSARTTGKDLVQKLDSGVATEVDGLKKKISAIVEKDIPVEEAEEETIHAVRAAGVSVKELAQAVREWRKTFDKELHDTVVKAADIHFQILDETRNLALQQIGMKWAWADGVTYKDWEKYHELKSTLREWTDQLKQLIVSHPGLIEAQDASAEVEDESMEIASLAAKELGRLKEVAHWKIVAKDATDNYESEAMKLAADTAEKAAQAAAEASKKAAEAEQTVVEQAEDAASAVKSNVEDAASAASESFAKGSAAASEGASNILSEGQEAFTEAAEEAQTKIVHLSSVAADEASEASEAAASVVDEVEGATYSIADDASSVVSDVFSEASEASSSASSAFSEEVTSATESIKSGEETASELASEATEVLVGATEPIVANVTDETDETDETADEDDVPAEAEEKPSDAYASVKPAMFGAAAQDVPERKPILENYDDSDDTVSNVRFSAESAYNNAVAAAAEHYSSAVSVVSAQIYGTPEPVHNELFASVSNAYDNAVAAANSRFNNIVKATPTPEPTPTSYVDWSKVEAIAAQRLNEGKLWAEVQYQSAVIALGLATPAPKSPSERYLEEAKKNYYAGIGLAQERYSSFMAAASSAMVSLTATPTPTDFAGTASSWASAARETAASAVKGAEDAAGAAYSAATGNVAAAVQAVDEGIVNAIDAASEQMYLAGATVAENWDNVIGQLSGRIYGEQKQIGWYDSLFKDASSAADAATAVAGDAAATASAEAAKQFSAVNDLVSELVSGKEPTFTESVLSRLNKVYATAVANVGSYASDASQAAASVGDKVSSAVSHATDAVKETVQGHPRDEL